MKKILTNYSKEVIKSRMLQNAAKLWGVNNPNALDPFVVLLIDAFSTEIFKVNNDIEDVKSSVLEKTARLLTPTIYTNPRPAHGIAIAESVEARGVLMGHQEFFVSKHFTSSVKSSADRQVNLPFTAIDNVNLIKARVDFMFTGSTVWQYDSFNNVVPTAKLPQAIKHNRLYLAVDFSAYDSEFCPDHLSLYCDNPMFDNLDFVYSLLPYTNTTVNGMKVQVTEGLTYSQKTEKKGYEAIFESYSVENRIEENIKAIYSGKFIELKGMKRKIEDLNLGMVPEELSFLNTLASTKALLGEKKLLWIQMDFPPQYNAAVLEGFSFYLNAFPVLNRGWKQNQSSLDVMGNNIPLMVEVTEEFLYPNTVIDSFGREYSEIPFSENSSLENGFFTIRKGGMERFSSRNAIDLISQVIELTRDEVSAFGVLERDKVAEALSNMVFQMRSLDQKVKALNGVTPSEVNYVIVEPLPNTEYLNASYWVTHCDFGNNVRKGAKLVQQNKVYTNTNQHIYLLSNTQGGEKEKTGTDAIQAYRYALTTRDKIISKEDIKNYCRLVVKENCVEVNISKGTMVSHKPKEGFIRTVNIEIVVRDFEEFNSDYWISYARSLKKQIASRSIDGIEYMVNFTGLADPVI